MLSFGDILFQALIVVFIFFPIYYIFFDLIFIELDNNASYDATRFLYGALNEGVELHEGSKEQILINLLRLSFIAGFPMFCPIILYISVFFAISMGVSLTKAIEIIIFSPAIIVFLETGKDIIIVASLVAFFSLFFISENIYIKRNILIRFLLVVIALTILTISVAVKGVTLSVYLVLGVIFYLETRGKLSTLVVAIILISSLLGGLLIRGVVDYDDVANLTAFNHEWLISSEIDFFLIFKAFVRFIVYASSPLWYWLFSIQNVTSNIFLIFHAWGYIMMLLCFFKYKWWKIKSYYIAAMAFSLSYPFVHLRYFFTFLVFICFAQAISNSIKFKSY